MNINKFSALVTVIILWYFKKFVEKNAIKTLSLFWCKILKSMLSFSIIRISKNLLKTPSICHGSELGTLQGIILWNSNELTSSTTCKYLLSDLPNFQVDYQTQIFICNHLLNSKITSAIPPLKYDHLWMSLIHAVYRLYYHH